MALQLSIIKLPQGVHLTDRDKEKVFTQAGGSVGRSAKNTWVLSDPNRYLSSCHIAIKYQQGKFVLMDTSTNGVFINASADPLGKNNVHALENGDRLVLGEYELFVSTNVPDPIEAEQILPETQIQPASHFAGNEDTSSTQIPSGSAAQPESPAPNAFDVDDHINDLLGPSSPHSVDPATIGSYDPNAFASDTSSLIDTDNSLDDLADLLDSDIPNTHETPFWQQPVSTSSHGEQHAPHHAAIKIPNAIEAGLDQTPSNTVNPGNIIPMDEDILPLSSAPYEPSAPPHTPVIEPKETAHSVPMSRPNPVEAGPMAAKVTAPASGLSPDVQYLLTQLGFAEDAIPPERAQELLSEIAQVIKETVKGLNQVLTSRSTIKDEFRMNVTLIKPVENNPLKFFVSMQDTLENMFIKQGEAYTSAMESVEEGFQDITEHQMAVLAGMRSAYGSLLKRFDPEKLQKRFDKKSQNGFFFSSKKARYWDSFLEYYQDIVPSEDDAFQRLFGEEFVHAYEDQLQKLTAARNKK